jgi:hypothetical protein
MKLEELSASPEEAVSDSLRTRFSRANLIFFAAVGLTFVIGISLRWTGLNKQSLWADEGYTTWFSQFSPEAQWRLMPWETQAPSYHIVLHYWTSVWGTSETAFRALSALFSTLSLIVLYLIARKMWPSRFFASLVLALSAISFFQIWYAKEARSYALLGFFLVASVYCLQLYLEKPTVPRSLGVIATICAGLYTHNMALFYVPGFVAFWFVYPSEMAFRRKVKNFAILGAAVALIYLPWLPMLAKQAISVHGYFWAPKPGIRDLCNSLCIFSGLDVNVLKILRYHVPIWRLFGFWFWVAIILSILALCIWSGWQGTSSADRRKCIALQLYALLPVVLVFAWSRVSTSVYVDRNFIGTCVLLPLVLCSPTAVHAGSRRSLFQMIGCVLLLGAVVSLCMQEATKDNWRGVANYLLKLPEHKRLVLVFQPYCQILVHYYATGLFKSYAQPEIEGLMTQFNVPPRGPGILPDFRSADPLAVLTTAIRSGRYREIDVALQMERLTPKVDAIPEFLKANCTSVEKVEFSKIAVSRCLLQTE